MGRNDEKTMMVTVVMTVYNASHALSRAIESVRKQTYADWLMICVNDGSTDDSLEILYEYARKDARITVLTQENGGPASARAKAYKQVTTPYVTYLDADDLYSSDMLKCLIEKARQTDADIIIPNCKCEQSDGTYLDWNAAYGWSEGTELTGKECFSQTFITPTIHGINMWRTSLVKQFALGDNADYNKMNADEYIQRLLFLNSRKVVFSGGVYFYKYNGQSITKGFSIRQLGYLDSWQIRLFKDNRCLSQEERLMMRRNLKEAYKEAMSYKSSFHFREKRFPKIYWYASASGYWIFCMTCFLFAMLQKYKNHND